MTPQREELVFGTSTAPVSGKRTTDGSSGEHAENEAVLLARQRRARELEQVTGLHLAGLLLDYGIILTENTDPIDAILRHEFPLGRE